MGRFWLGSIWIGKDNVMGKDRNMELENGVLIIFMNIDNKEFKEL